MTLPARSTPHAGARRLRLGVLIGIATCLGLAIATGTARGAPPPPVAQAAAPGNAGGPRWAELTPGQKQVLQPLANDWDTFDDRSKERWLGVATRFHSMPEVDKQRANQRMAEWARMSPQERSRARMNFQDLRSVSREERQARWEAYQALPEAQRQALAERAATAAAPSSAANAAAAAHRKHPAFDTVQPKTNVVGGLRDGRTPVEPGSVEMQVRPGATTTLVNGRATPAVRERAGQPKIAAGPKDVDRHTLLPKKGPQAVVGNAGSGKGGAR